MRELADLQQTFMAGVLGTVPDRLADLVVGDGLDPAVRLRIYRNSVRSVLGNALRLTYPAVDRLVGTAFFDHIADRFIGIDPPQSPCLDDYGSGFAAFLAEQPEIEGLAWLPDVARFEWALGVAAHAPDQPALDVAVLHELPSDLHHRLCFQAHASVTLLRLAHPADRIADAVLADDDAAMAAVDPASGPVALVVHRGSAGVTAERVGADEAAFLRRLFAGVPLGSVLAEPVADAAALLAGQLNAGRITAFRLAALD
jgi:hypothetical protein